jgi:uncharacterized protein
VTALFFGSSERRLFGVHHPPAGGTRQRHAVLLCYPGVQEYNGAHWLFRRLAGMLERAGYDVLRFDYFGTGDSAGDGIDGRLGIWAENVVQAGAELKELAGVRSLSVVGMRLGAALAQRACSGELRARTLVLWEPVTSGAEYLRELEDLDLRRNQWLLHDDPPPGPPQELMGYRVPSEVRSELLALELRTLPVPQAERVVIVAEQARESYDRLRDSLAAGGAPTTVRVVKDEGVNSNENRERAKLSHAVLVEIVNQLGQGAA